MKKSIFLLITSFLLKLGLAQSPNIEFHSCSPESVLTDTDIELTVTMINNGDAATESNTIVTLTSKDQYVTIVEGTATYAPMAAGATAEASFVINVNPMAPNGHSFDLSFKAVLEGSSVESEVYYDFESGVQDWTSIDADGDGFEWIESGAKLGPGYGHNSQYCMFSQSYDNTFDILYPDNYLVSPQKFKLSENASINFWACAQDMNYPAEHFGVAISTTGNTSDEDFTTIEEWTMTAKDQGNWYEYTADLSQYEGQEIWVAIRHFDCFDEYFLALDDVTFVNVFQPISWTGEFSVISENMSPNIVFHSFDSDVIMPGEEAELNITMINDGLLDNTCNTEVTISTNNQYINITNPTASLNPMNINDTQSVSFNISTNASTPIGQEIEFDLNVIPTTVDGEEISFTYQFENDLNGWTTIDANKDDHYWYHTSETDIHDAIMIQSHSGKGHLMSESYCNASMSELSPDDYIVSPNLIGVTENTTISFWACAQDEDYPDEHFGIAVSTTGNDSPEDFTTIAEWTLTAKDSRAGNWYMFTADLSDYAGQYIWVALRHFNSTNIFILCVDDISINNFVKYEEWNSSFTMTIGGESLTELNNEIKVYPNPVNDMIYINTNDNIKSVEIYDILGIMVQSENVVINKRIDMTALSSGIYFVKIITDKGNNIVKIQKK